MKSQRLNRRLASKSTGKCSTSSRPPDRPGQYHYTWVSGPNPGYGFSEATSDGRALSNADFEASIRNFLAQVDPGTGYIE